MARLAGDAIAAEEPGLPRVLGGISPIDPLFIQNMQGQGPRARRRRGRARVPAGLEPLDARRVAGPAEGDPRRHRPAGVGIGGRRLQLRRRGGAGVRPAAHAELLIGRSPRIHWYSLYDLPRAWPATTRHREAEGSSLPPLLHGPAARGRLAQARAQAVHRLHARDGHLPVVSFRGSRLQDAVRWLRRLGVNICAPASAGPTSTGRTRSPGSIGRCARSRSSRSR